MTASAPMEALIVLVADQRQSNDVPHDCVLHGRLAAFDWLTLSFCGSKKKVMKTEANAAMTAEPPLALRILIADDNPDILLTLRMWLEADGHVVRTVSSGASVLPTVREYQPDVCLLDIHMPSGNGFAIGKELKTTYGGRRPFQIAISGKFYSAADRLVALDAGFDHFFEKPADPRELSRLLRDVARRRAAA
jgi:CheY-like chemotaxis protein